MSSATKKTKNTMSTMASPNRRASPLTNTILPKNILPGVSIEDPDQTSLRADLCPPTNAVLSEDGTRVANRPQRSLVVPIDGATRRQMRVEAARYSAKKATLPPDIRTIPHDMRVEKQPDDLYRPPEWLGRTATAAQVSELADLLDELRSVNQEFVGELMNEVFVYFAATNLDVDLTNRFRTWCDTYVRRRADPANMNPRVGLHPSDLHRKVWGEVIKILSPIESLKHTLNVMFLKEPIGYSDWLAYDLLWKGDLRKDEDGWFRTPESFSGGEAMGKQLFDYAAERHFLDDGMPWFLARVKTWAAERGQHAKRDEEELRSGLSSLASDIQVMRPLLVHNFNPTKTVLRLADELLVAWDWQAYNGIGHILTGRSEKELLTVLATNCGLENYVVRHDGLLAYTGTPWRTSAGLTEGDPLAANYSLLEWFRDRLFSFYDRINLTRMGFGTADKVGDGATADPMPSDVELIAADLARETETADGQTLPEPNRRVPGIRFLRFERVMERLGCEVRGAKGSDVSVYRPGFRKYVLGRHRVNREVFPVEILRVLSRLKFTTEQWLEAVRG